MKDYHWMIILAIFLFVPGVYCLYNMTISHVIAALGGGLTTNGVIAGGGAVWLKMLDLKASKLEDNP